MCPNFSSQSYRPRAPTFADMFAGGGGLSYGFHLQGFNIVAAWETDPAARYTYHVHHCERNQTVLYGDVTDVDETKLPSDLDVLGGGPPCQSLSTSQGVADPDDPRHQLPFSMVEWADVVDPRVVLIENVTGLTNRHGDIHSSLLTKLKRAGSGYQVNSITLNAADYGVPQCRDRVFIIAIRTDLPTPDKWKPDQTAHKTSVQTLTGDKLDAYATASEALESLPEPIPSQSPSDDPVHTSIEEYQPAVGKEGRHRIDPHSVPETVSREGSDEVVPPNHVAINHSGSVRQAKAELELGASISETDRRLHPDQPAPTLTVSQGSPPFHYRGKSPQFPSRSVEHVRRLTPREAARLQTFDDNYVFAGTKTEQYRIIANAVPPLLAAHVANHIRKNILNHQFLEEKENSEADSQAETTATSRESAAD
ncbi:DNA cytosine methyltransferase [Halorubrum sp. ASP1]|nr:DNA cytosine methyltransferase [Halorubrum sp. ASP1]